MSRKNYPYGVPVHPAPAGANPFGEVRYVAASGGDDGNYGKNGSKPLATIAKAISLSAAGDTVILGPGTHSVDVSVAALIPKADMQFIAAIPPLGGKPATIITHDADDGVDLVTIDVDGTGWHGIEFLMVAGGTTALRTMSVAQTTAVAGLVLKDCWFNQNSVDATGCISLAINDATNATEGLVVKNCRFFGADATTAVGSNIAIGVGGATNALIEGNVIIMQSIDGDCTGITFGDPGAAGGSYGITIRNNDFIGPIDGGGDAVGITFTGAMTEDEIVGIIRTNYFSNCTAPITVDEANNSLVWNYVGDDATGGTLVDPGT